MQHHCRNCGDLFCDRCTQGRTEDGTLQILSVPSHFSQVEGMFEETEFEAWNYYGRLLTLILCI